MVDFACDVSFRNFLSMNASERYGIRMIFVNVLKCNKYTECMISKDRKISLTSKVYYFMDSLVGKANTVFIPNCSEFLNM